MFNTITVEVDLEDYESEIFEYAENNGYINSDQIIYKDDLKEIINDLEKELYMYIRKSEIKIEDIINKLKGLL